MVMVIGDLGGEVVFIKMASAEATILPGVGGGGEGLPIYVYGCAAPGAW
jgi:hypothetical protein